MYACIAKKTYFFYFCLEADSVIVMWQSVLCNWSYFLMLCIYSDVIFHLVHVTSSIHN